MLAQRYPDAYDGIVAGAPAIHFPRLQPNIYWPNQFMNMNDAVPYPCELDDIRAAAIKACDEFDDVVDGVIGEPNACLDKFNPFDLAGKSIKCPEDSSREISPAAAAVVNATWQGMTSADGRRTGYRFSLAADLTGNDPAFEGTLGPFAINCTSGACDGQPNPQVLQRLQVFAAADPSLDISSLSHAQFDALVHSGVQRYSSIIGTDLSVFRDARGEMVTYHGLVNMVRLRQVGRTNSPAVG